MKKLFITLAAAVLAIISVNAEEKTKTYDFGDIRSIDANFVYNIHVTEGKSSKVKVVYDDKIDEFMKLDISYYDGTLKLYKKEEKKLKRWVNNTYKVNVYLEMDHISSITLSGASRATFSGTFKADDLNVKVYGASSLKELNVNGNDLDADCSGASNANLAGNFSEDVDIELSGASKMTYSGDSENFEATLSGASKFICAGNFGAYDIKCSGASNATIKGKAENAEFECSGASYIDAEEFPAKTVEVELSGASNAKVNAEKDLYYDVPSACKMTYFGDAELHNNTKGSNIVRGR